MAVRSLLFALLAALLVSACSGGDDAAGTTLAPETTTTTTPPDTTTGDPATTTAPATTTTTAAPTTAAPAGTVIEVTVEGGEPTVAGASGGRVSVPLGEQVTVRVSSDTADQLHVHGYDLLLDLEAGATRELTFTADVPGVFEVELESSHVHVFSLEVGA